MKRTGFVSFSLILVACGPAETSSNSDAGDAGVLASDAFGTDSNVADASAAVLGMVTNVTDVACPPNAPKGTTCRQIAVTGCPTIESESINATVAVLPAQGTVMGTVTHFSGGGGQGFENAGSAEYAAAGLRQVWVAWKSDWEQTQAAGIKTAGCRPATVLAWIFAEPTLHNGSRTTAFCGQGFSGGSGQLGYALAHYGLASELDYVNELSGPPFARIDLGCDGDAPSTATVCGVSNTMVLPPFVSSWEHIKAPLACGSTGVPKAELDRWKSDSIAIGGVYDYPKTDVEFFDCTHQSTAVTAMAQIYKDVIAQTEGAGGLVGYHCFSQTDGCSGEGLGSGTQQAVSSLIAGCKPRH